MEPTCVIYNKTGQMQVLNLPHWVAPEHAATGVVGIQTSVVKKDAVVKGRRHVEVERSVRAIKRPISGSVTLLAKGHDGDSVVVARSALFALDVDNAIKANRIGVSDAPTATEETEE